MYYFIYERIIPRGLDSKILLQHTKTFKVKLMKICNMSMILDFLDKKHESPKKTLSY